MDTYINNLLQNLYNAFNGSKFILLSVFISLISVGSFAQTVLVTETFEGIADGYTGNNFNTNANEYFERKLANSTDIDAITLSGEEGLRVWASENVSTERNFILNTINTAGYECINVDILVAANTAGFEPTDFIRVEYAFDADIGSSYAIAGAFYGFSGGGGTMYLDANLDGDSEEPHEIVDLTDAMQDFNFSIPATGNLLSIRVSVLSNANNEAIVFDNLRVNGYNRPTATNSLSTTFSFGSGLSADSQPNGATVSAISGTGITDVQTTPSYRMDDWDDTNTTSVSNVNTEYWSFTVTPDAGWEMDISCINFENTGENDGNAPDNWEIRSNKDDSYLTALASGIIPRNGTYLESINLSGFTSLTSAVTFRLYAYSAANNQDGNRYWQIDNLVVNGFLEDVTPPTISSATQDNSTTITVTFDEPVQTNETNPTDFTVVDGQGTNFAVGAQVDNIASDANIVLTVADMTLAVGDITVTYANNNTEVSDLASNPLATDATGVTIDTDNTPPMMASATQDNSTTITVTFDEDVQTNETNPTDFTVVDGQGTGFAVSAQMDNVASDALIVLTVADMSTAVGDLTVTYTNNSSEVTDFGSNDLATDGTGVTIDTDNTAPMMASATQDNSTTITVTFDEDVQTNETNPTDFTVVDGQGTGFAVSAQMDNVASDALIVLTVADMSTAVGDLTVTYTNNSSEVTDFGSNDLATDGIGVTIDTDITAPMMVSATQDNNTTITVTFNEDVQTNETNPTDFTVVDQLATSYAVSAQIDNIANDGLIVLTVADMSTAVGDITITYTNNSNEVSDFGGNFLITDGTGVTINDVTAPTMQSASQDNTTTITVTFDEPVQTNETNPIDFIVVDGQGTGFAVSAQVDNIANDANIVLTVADMTLAVGDITVTYANNNTEVSDLASNPLVTDATGVTIDTDNTAPMMVSATQDNSTTITVTFNEDVQTNETNPTDFTVVDGQGTNFAVGAQVDNIADDTDIVVTVADVSTAVGDLTITYTNNSNEISDFGGNNAVTDATGITIDTDNIAPMMVSATQDNSTTITVTFNEDVQTNETNPTDFTVVDQLATSYAVSAQIDNIANDGLIVLTVADMSAAVGDITITYTNNSNEVSDFGGNFLSTDATGVIIADITNPLADITYDDADGFVKAGQVLRITAIFDEPMAGVPEVQIALSSPNVVALTNMTFVSSTEYYYDHTVTVGDGTVTVSLGTGTDVAGNLITSVPNSGATFEVDNMAPSAPGGLDLATADDTGFDDADEIINITSGITISGTCEAFASIELFDIAVSLGTVADSDGDGNWTIDVSLAAGIHNNITAIATDRADNVGVASAPFTIEVDTTPPDALTISFNANAAGPGTQRETFDWTFTEAVTNINDGTGITLADFTMAGFSVNVDGIDLSTYTNSSTTGLLRSSSDISGWSAATDITYTPGNIYDVAGNSMAGFTSNASDAVAPFLIDGMVFNPNGTGAETIVFHLSESLTLSNGDPVTGFTVDQPAAATAATAVYTGKGSTETITLTSTGDGVWTDEILVTYSGAGNATDGTNQLAGVTNQPMLIKDIIISSSNAISPTTHALQGNTIIVGFTATSTLDTAPLVTIDVHGPVVATTADVFAPYAYTAVVTTDGTTNEGLIGFSIPAIESGNTTTILTTTDNPSTPSTMTFDRTDPNITSVDDEGGDNTYRSGEVLTVTANLAGETGLTVTANLTTINTDISFSTAQTLYDDGTNGDNTVGDGIYSYQINNVDLNGTMNESSAAVISVTATDIPGNSTIHNTYTVLLDKSAPVFGLIDDNGGDNTYKAGETITITVDMGEAGLTVIGNLQNINSDFSATQAFFDDGATGGDVSAADGIYTFTTIDVDNGGNMVQGTSQSVTFTATDVASNQTLNSSLTFYLDKIAPTAFNVGSLITQGPANNVTGYWNEDNTGINVIVPINNADLSLDGGFVQLRAQAAGGTFADLGTSSQITNTEFIVGNKTIFIDATTFEGIAGVIATPTINDGDGDVISIAAIITDIAGNSTIGSASATTIIIDQTDPTISPNEISLNSSSDMTFTISETLNFGPAPTNGFTTSNGTIDTQEYSDVGTSNIITLTGSGWNAITTVSYSGVGNIVDLAGNPMAIINNQAVDINIVNMGPGDLAFTYYRSDDPNEFAFVLLKDVPATSRIKFTNNGWNQGTTSLRTSEETIIWEADVNYYAGSEIRINGISPSHGNLTGDELTLDTDGDQIFAYQGTSINPTFIAGIHNNGGWDSDNSNQQESMQPSQLITVPPSSFNISSEADNAVYDRGVLSGTTADILNDINLSGSWDTDDTGTNNITVPSAGLTNFLLPPDLDMVLSPTNGGLVSEELTQLQIDFSENITKDPFFGDASQFMSISKVSDLSKVHQIDISNTGVITAADIATIPFDADNVILTDGLLSENLINGEDYVVDIPGFLFINTDGNHNEPIVGSTSWSFTYDNDFPQVTSVVRKTGQTNPVTDNNSVVYTVTFDQDVTGVNIGVNTTDFNLTGTAVSGSEVITASANSATEYEVTISGLDLSDAITIGGSLFLNVVDNGTIIDNAGNTLGGVGLQPNYVSDESFTMLHEEPADHVSGFSVFATTTSSVTLQWTETLTNQRSQHYLIIAKANSGGTYLAVADNSFVVDDNTIFTDDNGAYSVVAGTTSFEFPGLTSATTYDFQIIPYTNGGVNILSTDQNEVLYKTNGTIPEVQATTPAATNSTIVFNSAATTISSVADTPGEAVSVFSFTISDDGASAPGLEDSAPTKITTMKISAGAGDEIPLWNDAIAVATLSDGVNPAITGTIDLVNDEIDFTLDPDLEGTIGINLTKTYTLNIYLKSSLGGTLAQDIDQLYFEFEILATNITTAVSGSSGMLSTESAGSNDDGNSNNLIEVTATQFELTQAASTEGVNVALINPPTIIVKDENGNLDLNYTSGGGTFTLTRLDAGDPNGFANDATFIFGNNAELNMSSFQYTSAGDGRLRITGTSPIGQAMVAGENAVNTVDVINTIFNQAIAQSSGNINISSGNTIAILGFGATSSTPNGIKPVLDGFTVRFNQTVSDFYTDLRIFKSTNNDFNIDDDNIVTTISNPGFSISPSGNNVVVSGLSEVLTDGLTNYYFLVVTVDAGAQQGISIGSSISNSDIALEVENGSITPFDFIGSSLDFTDNTAPEYVQLLPMGENSSTASNLVIVFDEPVFSLDNKVGLYLKDGTFLQDILLDLSVIEPTNTLVFDVPGALLLDDTDYYVLVAPGNTSLLQGIQDEEGNEFTGITSDTEWAFKTADADPPLFQAPTPDIVNVFNEGFDLLVNMDEPSRIYYMVIEDGSFSGTPPTIEELIRRDANGIAIAVDYAGTFVVHDTLVVNQESKDFFASIIGLTPNTDYTVFYTAVDVVDNRPIGVTPFLNQTTPNSNSAGIIYSNPSVEICVGEYQEITSPIHIQEGADNDFSSGNSQTIFFSLPANYEFKIDPMDLPEVQYLASGDISSQPTIELINNSLGKITLDVSPGGNDRDRITITNLKVKSNTNSATADILKISGSFTDIPDNEPLAELSVQAETPAAFTLQGGSFSISNIIEKVGLIPDASIIDEGSNVFSGTGVVVDTLFVTVAGIGIHDISLTHTTNYGCVSNQIEEVLIFDNTQVISGLDPNYCTDEFDAINFETTIVGNNNNTEEALDLIALTIDGGQTTVADFSNIIDRTNEPSNWGINFDGAGVGQVAFVATFQSRIDASITTRIQFVTISNPPDLRLTISGDDFNDDGLNFCQDSDVILIVGINQNENNLFSYVHTLGLDFDRDGIPDNNAGLTDGQDGNGEIDPESLATTNPDFALLGGYGQEFDLIYSVNNLSTTCSSVTIVPIIINEIPTADFTTEINGSDTGLKGCAYDDAFEEETTLTFIPNNTGAIMNHAWDFDDSKENTSILSNPTHQYDNVGTYAVEYFVTSDRGCVSSIAQKDINIGNNPTPDFTYHQIGIDADTKFQNATSGLTLADPDDDVLQVIWEYENGGVTDILIGANSLDDVSYQYVASPGIKNVRMTVTTVSGCERFIEKDIFVVPVETVAASSLYQEGFDGSNTNDWIPIGKAGGTSSWQIAQSGGTGTITESSNFWVTGTDAGGYGLESSYLYSPIFDLSGLERPLVDIRQFSDFRAGNADGVYIEYMTYDDDNPTPWIEEEWTPLGTVGSGVEWFDSNDIISFNAAGLINNGNDYGWSNSNAGWRRSKHSLSSVLIDSRDRVQFRFSFISGSIDATGRDGFALDNVQIGERTRTVLVENFTNSSKQTEVFEENDFLNNTFLSGNLSGVEVIKINYHTDFPGPDPANELNPTDHGARAAYYNISSVPRAVLDGDNSETGFFSDWGTNAFEQRSLILAEFKMNITPTLDGSLLNIQIDMETDPQQPRLNQSDLILNVAIIENNVVVPVQPSTETMFFDVVRDLLPSAAGTLIPFAETTGTFSRSFSWIPSDQFDVDGLSAVAFLQDEISRVVYQAEIVSLTGLPLQAVTGLDDPELLNFSLYPNPATDQVTLSFGRQIDDAYNLKVYDRFGKLLYEQAIDQGTQKVSFDTQSYINGFYFIQIESPHKVIARQKLIIMKQ